MSPDPRLPGATLVMPAAFRAVAPFTVLRDEDERIFQYMCGLVAWAQPQRVRRIVLTENSNTRFDFSRIAAYLGAAGKELEVLVFAGTTDAATRGKGVGEGEMLEHAFTHSRLLRTSDTFYKITGRIFVANFDEVDASAAAPDVFRRKTRRPPKPSKANTVFFKCSRALFEARLLHAYRDIDELAGVYAEHVYYDRLRDLDPPDFSVPPVLVGQQASTGKPYDPYPAEVMAIARSLM